MSKQIHTILNIEKPIIQGPMAWSSFAPLVVAVSNAGGLGVLGIAGAPASLVQSAIKEVKSKTDKPFGINVYLNLKVVDEILPILLKEKPAVVYVGFTDHLDKNLCEQFFTPIKKAGIKIIVKVTNLLDALDAQNYGADMVVAKGWEGGGYLSEEATMSLIPILTENLDIPVIASGGIVNGKTMAAAFALGASGIEMGSVFLVAKENEIHQLVKEAIIHSKDNSSTIIGQYVDMPIRLLKNKFSGEIEDLEKYNNIKDIYNEVRLLISNAFKKAIIDGDIGHGAVMVSQSSSLIHKEKTAKEIIDSTIKEYNEVIRQLKTV